MTDLERAGLAFLGLRLLSLKEPPELQAADRLEVLLQVFTVATGQRGELAHVHVWGVGMARRTKQM